MQLAYFWHNIVLPARNAPYPADATSVLCRSCSIRTGRAYHHGGRLSSASVGWPRVHHKLFRFLPPLLQHAHQGLVAGPARLIFPWFEASTGARACYLSFLRTLVCPSVCAVSGMEHPEVAPNSLMSPNHLTTCISGQNRPLHDGMRRPALTIWRTAR